MYEINELNHANNSCPDELTYRNHFSMEAEIFPQIAQIKVIYKMLPLLLLLPCMTKDIHMAGILKADAQDDIT